jgi:hypothetical protein
VLVVEAVEGDETRSHCAVVRRRVSTDWPPTGPGE